MLQDQAGGAAKIIRQAVTGADLTHPRAADFREAAFREADFREADLTHPREHRATGVTVHNYII
ncbi:MAG: pentapeptide repeat-containing protein [Bacillota bacterium]